ncbi:uncharacterized protein EHS24_006713 [Apiotrichum porosum]|uniref:DUF967 domain protein n=1 Tax=Apiotrichum porosum TaxID=105984 RepID=A0A427Y231_9TREE|nr:uncharacterized protein EHS24_006713 [Apiotrichum porosum]RSH85120.1 hypothetical protein EHS24_006713 [Apiotrichum porosum]
MRKATDYSETDPELSSVLQEHEKTLRLPSFSAEIAWEIGSLLRKRFVEEKAPLGLSAAIQIRAFPEGSSKNPLVLFATTVGDVMPGISSLVAGKANVVSWTGRSTYLSRIDFKKHGIDLAEFGLPSPEYFMHGGAFPVRLVNHEAPVAVIIVSGMPSMADDHQIIVDTVEAYLASLK